MTQPACRNCGAERTGPYCARCGQQAIEGRPTLRRLAREVVDRTLGLEQGFFHTIARLTVAPGTVTRDYIDGRTRPYTHPLAYLALSFAAFALIGELVSVGATPLSEGNAGFTGLVVLFIAAVSRLLDRHRLNYAEHLIVAMYLVGHMAMILAVGQLATPFVSAGALRIIGLAAVAAALLCYVRGYATTVRRGAVAGAALALATLAGGIGIWFVAVFLLVRSLSS